MRQLNRYCKKAVGCRPVEEHLPSGAEAEPNLKEGEHALLELVSLEAQSFAVASEEDHAQELLTPSYQVRPAQPVLTFHLCSLGVRPRAKEPVL